MLFPQIAALNQQVTDAKKKADEESEKVSELDELRKKMQKVGKSILV